MAGSTADDPYARFRISGGGTNWSIGLDNSSSDAFKVSNSSALGTNDFLTIATSGLVTVASRITGVSNGTIASDAATFGQLAYFQTVQATTTSSTSTTSSTFADTSLTASITPSVNTHRVKVTVHGSLATASTATTVELTIKRGTTNLAGSDGFAIMKIAASATTRCTVPMVFIDSPATTSSTTYTVQIRSSDNATSVTFCAGETAVIILEEIV